MSFVDVYVALSRPSAQDQMTKLRYDPQSSGRGTFCKGHRTAKKDLIPDRMAKTDDGVRELRFVPVIMSLMATSSGWMT
jgi:hypothetical protein